MISLKNITKRYCEKTVFNNFNLDIEENKITVILGESGSGKTTLLNMLAGITDFDGEISGVYGGVSMVFQRDRLVPHLTVKENILLVSIIAIHLHRQNKNYNPCPYDPGTPRNSTYVPAPETSRLPLAANLPFCLFRRPLLGRSPCRLLWYAQ